MSIFLVKNKMTHFVEPEYYQHSHILFIPYLPWQGLFSFFSKGLIKSTFPKKKGPLSVRKFIKNDEIFPKFQAIYSIFSLFPFLSIIFSLKQKEGPFPQIKKKSHAWHRPTFGLRLTQMSHSINTDKASSESIHVVNTASCAL